MFEFKIAAPSSDDLQGSVDGRAPMRVLCIQAVNDHFYTCSALDG